MRILIRSALVWDLEKGGKNAIHLAIISLIPGLAIMANNSWIIPTGLLLWFWSDVFTFVCEGFQELYVFIVKAQDNLISLYINIYYNIMVGFKIKKIKKKKQ